VLAYPGCSEKRPLNGCHNGQQKPNVRHKEQGAKGLVVLLEIVGLEVTAKSIGTDTHLKADTH